MPSTLELFNRVEIGAVVQRIYDWLLEESDLASILSEAGAGEGAIGITPAQFSMRKSLGCRFSTVRHTYDELMQSLENEQNACKHLVYLATTGAARLSRGKVSEAPAAAGVAGVTVLFAFSGDNWPAEAAEILATLVAVEAAEERRREETRKFAVDELVRTGNPYAHLLFKFQR